MPGSRICRERRISLVRHRRHLGLPGRIADKGARTEWLSNIPLQIQARTEGWVCSASGARRILTAWGGVSCSSPGDRKSTRLNSSHPSISYAVFCLKKKKKKQQKKIK